MPRNGSGTFVPPSNSWNPQVNGALATPADFAAQLSDLSNALTQSVSADGQTPIVGNLQMGNNKLTGLAAGNGTGDSLRWEQLFSQGVPIDIASAATVDIGAQNTCFLNLTGVTTITSFGNNYNGPRYIKFAGSLTLTYNATTLILPGAANITTAAGDIAIVIPKSTSSGTPDGWQVISYIPAYSGSPGTYSITGLTGTFNAVTPATKFDVTSTSVTTFRKFYPNVGTKTVDITIQGLGGRDQVAAFAAFDEPNLFYVPNGSGGLSVVASLNSFVTGPTGYTEWVPIMNHKLNGGAQFYTGELCGKQFLLKTLQPAVSGSANPFPTSNSYANYAPLGAVSVIFNSYAVASSGPGTPLSVNHNLSETSSTKYLIPILAGVSSNISSPLGNVTLTNLSARNIYTGYTSASGLATWSQTVNVVGWNMGT